MFTQVLAYSLRGCGSSLTRLKASARFRAVLQEQCDLFDTVSGDWKKALILGKGTRAFGKFLISGRILHWKKLQQEGDETYGPDERALIHCFAEELLQSAKAALPSRAIALAGQWRKASTKRRVRIAEQFLELFAESDGNIFIDELSQTPQRVLPGRFSLEAEGKQRPNCVGRMLLAAAFFELCGAQFFSNIVTVPATVKRDEGELFLWEKILRCIKRRENYFAKEYRDAVGRSRQRAVERLAQPVWLHGSLKVRLNRTLYFDFDPMHNKIARTEFRDECLERIGLLRSCFDVAPGSSVSFRNSTFWQYKKSVKSHAARFERLLAKFAAEVPKGSSEMAVLYDALYHSDLIYLLLAALGLEKESVFADPSARYHLCKRYQYSRHLKSKIRDAYVRGCLTTILASKTSWEEDTGVETAVILSKEELLSLRKKYAREVIKRIPAYLANGLIAVSRREWNTRCQSAPHCEAELGNARWQIACAVLGHIGVTTGDWKDTEAVLARHCFSQYRLYYHALQLEDGFCNEALRSAECLKRKEGLINSAQTVLPRLAKQHGVELWKGSKRVQEKEREEKTEDHACRNHR